MSLQRTLGLALAAAIATCLMGASIAPAAAAPSAAEAAIDRATLDRAIRQYQVAQTRSAKIDARLAEVSARLDRAIAEENQSRDLLRSRVVAMYRSGNVDTLSALLGATSLDDLATRWELLIRIAQQDADTVRTLKAARIEAKRSAGSLLQLQAAQVRALDASAKEVATARRELAASKAALREYEARIAASEKPPPEPVQREPRHRDPTQQLSGSGDWLTAVASHYGRNFTGRGASGERIGPYSMIVAHKTLAFGTLVEFEYGGKRAVARVADRGPHTHGRTFDLGPGVVRVLDFSGVHELRYRIIAQ